MAEGSVRERILAALEARKIAYREVEHEPTRTSEESAQARGEPLGCGAKALLLKVDEAFALFVLPADRQLDSAALKPALGAKRVRFATPEELLAVTGLVPGSVPPFGAPFQPFPLYADPLVGVRYPQVAFNCGSLRHSVIMRAEDWERLAVPTRLAFAK